MAREIPNNENAELAEQKTVVVTGASGFIGINLVKHLADRGHLVHAVSRSAPESWRYLDSRATPHQWDMTDTKTSQLLANLSPDAIVHLAAGPSKAKTPEERHQALEIDVLGAHTLIEAAEIASCRIVHAGSSFEAVASSHGAPFRAVSKSAAAAVVRQSTVDAALLRIGRAYGPWEQPGRLLYRLLEAAGTEETVALTPDDATRSYVFVGDVCQAIEAVLQHPGAYELDIAGEHRLTARVVAETVEKVTGRKLRVEIGKYPIGAIDRFVPPQDLNRTRELIGWSPATSLEVGIALMDEWFSSQRRS